MGRLVNLESAGRERTRLTKALVLAIRELVKQPEPNAEARDLAAFTVLVLERIAETIEVSVAAWEKRNYWIKADKFREKWGWSHGYASRMSGALLDDDWAKIAEIVAKIGERLNNIEVSDKHRLGQPWIGAWYEFKARPPKR